jgi:predicted TIM-barrel fold metal-dependent hydrolase
LELVHNGAENAMIDVHNHLWDSPGYLDALVEASHAAGIKQICLNGLGPGYRLGANEDVLAAARAYPETVIPVGYLRLGVDPPGTVTRLAEQGFMGLKVINPLASYGNEDYFVHYDEAAALGLSILFHTGIIARRPDDRKDHVNCAKMKPVALDAIARAIPDLNLIMAHIGGPWYEEAFMVTRVNPNVYCDITCGAGWLVKGMGPDYFREKLWWPGAWEKILFGTDVKTDRIQWAVDEHRAILDGAGVPSDVQEKIYQGTARRLLRC